MKNTSLACETQLRDQAACAFAEINEPLVPVFACVEEHAELFRRCHSAAAAAGWQLSSADVAPLATTFRASVERFALVVDGMGIVAAPGILRDAPMFLEWWRRGDRGELKRLSVSFEPDDPEYYMYDEAEWFRVPAHTGRAWMMGPFVDHGGTNLHICSFQQPVRGDDEASTFLGVAGADLRVGEIEHTARRALTAIPVSAALINYQGRVIAANGPDLLPGLLLDETFASWVARTSPGWHPHGGGYLLRDDKLPWSIAIFARW